MPDNPIHVTAGFGWTAAGAWITALSVLGTIITLLIKQIGPWKKQTTDAESELRDKLSARIDGLEKQVDLLRAELLAQAIRSEKIIADMRAQHALELHQTREQHLLEMARSLGRKIEGEKP
jgi:hypothetical protein